jgi:hypothetical protein
MWENYLWHIYHRTSSKSLFHLRNTSCSHVPRLLLWKSHHRMNPFVHSAL